MMRRVEDGDEKQGRRKKGRLKRGWMDSIKEYLREREGAIRGQDYKRFSSMSRRSTHNLCSEMT